MALIIRRACGICSRMKSSFIYQMPKRHNSSENLLYTLMRRGLVKQIFPPDQSVNIQGCPSAYAGFDATSDSLHVGNLLVLVALLHWQRAGYNIVVVVGDATAEVGDPSGHKSDRTIFSSEKIKENCDSVEKNLIEIFDNHEKYLFPKGKIKNKLGELSIFRNSDWYEKISIIDFISYAGRHIRVGDMLSRTSVRTRMESGAGINFSEFSYQVFQSYDWLHLFEKNNCQIQFGGSDQLGNITSGYNLISATKYQHVYGALLPLIQSETGDKFGKSAGNAVYLSSHRTSPLDLYQFFIRLPDADAANYLKLFTFLDVGDIEDIVYAHMVKNPNFRKAQKCLAREVTLLVHGEKGLNFAENATQILYNSDLESLTKLNVQELNQVFPLSTLSEVPFEPGTTLYDLTMKIGCFASKNDANRIIREGGVYLNFERITTPEYVIIPDIHILSNGISLIRIGKKTYYLVLWK